MVKAGTKEQKTPHAIWIEILIAYASDRLVGFFYVSTPHFATVSHSNTCVCVFQIKEQLNGYNQEGERERERNGQNSRLSQGVCTMYIEMIRLLNQLHAIANDVLARNSSDWLEIVEPN